MKKIFLAVLSGLMFISGTVAASTVSYDQKSFDNVWPFASGPMNYEQVYAWSQFNSATYISGISFKAAQNGLGHAFGPTPVTLSIDLSTTSVTPSTISANFAANQGADDVQVFSGTTNIFSSGADTFDIFIPFASNFFFDPQAGNLLVHLNVLSSQWNVGPFAFGYSPLVGRAVSNYNVSGANEGLATQFTTADADAPVNVPEPTSVALFGIGLLGFSALRRQSKK